MSELINLVKASIIDGKISDESLSVIQQKAKELGVSQAELDIYIKKEITNETKPKFGFFQGWGIWILICGIGDFFWGLVLSNRSYTQDYAPFFLITGAILILIGLRMTFGKKLLPNLRSWFKSFYAKYLELEAKLLPENKTFKIIFRVVLVLLILLFFASLG